MKLNIRQTAYIVSDTVITESIADSLKKAVSDCQLIWMTTANYKYLIKGGRFTRKSNVCVYIGKDYSFTKDTSGYVRNGTQAEELAFIHSKDSYQRHYASTIQAVDESGSIRQIFNSLLEYCNKENLWYIDTTTDDTKMYQPAVESTASRNAIELSDIESLWQRATGLDATTIKWAIANNYSLESEMEIGWKVCPTCHKPYYIGSTIVEEWSRTFNEPIQCDCGYTEW